MTISGFHAHTQMYVYIYMYTSHTFQYAQILGESHPSGKWVKFPWVTSQLVYNSLHFRFAHLPAPASGLRPPAASGAERQAAAFWAACEGRCLECSSRFIGSSTFGGLNMVKSAFCFWWKLKPLFQCACLAAGSLEVKLPTSGHMQQQW